MHTAFNTKQGAMIAKRGYLRCALGKSCPNISEEPALKQSRLPNREGFYFGPNWPKK